MRSLIVRLLRNPLIDARMSAHTCVHRNRTVAMSIAASLLLFSSVTSNAALADYPKLPGGTLLTPADGQTVQGSITFAWAAAPLTYPHSLVIACRSYENGSAADGADSEGIGEEVLRVSIDSSSERVGKRVISSETLQQISNCYGEYRWYVTWSGAGAGGSPFTFYVPNPPPNASALAELATDDGVDSVASSALSSTERGSEPAQRVEAAQSRRALDSFFNDGFGAAVDTTVNTQAGTIDDNREYATGVIGQTDPQAPSLALSERATMASPYLRVDAFGRRTRDWAWGHWNADDSGECYRRFGNNCQHFASCAWNRGGGVPMDYGNDIANIYDLVDRSWFIGGFRAHHSKSWTAVDWFGNYWGAGRGRPFVELFAAQIHLSRPPQGPRARAASDSQIGDIVQYDWGDGGAPWDHANILTWVNPAYYRYRFENVDYGVGEGTAHYSQWSRDIRDRPWNIYYRHKFRLGAADRAEATRMRARVFHRLDRR